jgi:hypothetical protein
MKVLQKMSRALAWHKERHRPTGFDFAIADSVDYLDGAAWDGLTANASVFLKRPFLRNLEKHSPDNVKPRAALIFKGRTPVAAVAMQSVGITASNLVRAGEKIPSALKKLEARVIVCGNLLSWGQHAVAFAPGIDPAEVWPGVAEALYRVRRAEHLSGRADFIMIKDLRADDEAAGTLARFSYGPVETDPNMVVEISPSWKTFDDYLASLHSKYRKNALKVGKDLESAGCRLEPLTDLSKHSARLHELYLEVHDAAAVRPVTISPNYLLGLAETYGADFRCTVARRGDEILGFVTTLKDGDDAVGYYIGFDRSKKQELPLYFGLLQSTIADAIALGCRRLSLGRTALEPKAKLGALPVRTRIWVRHSAAPLNLLVGGLLGAVPHGEAPDRNPFKGPENA